MEYANEPKVIAILDYLVFAMANSELLVPEQANIVKTNINSTLVGLLDFEWQGGYAEFGVSQSNLEQVKRYLANQEEHHRKMSFQDELRALLRKHEIEWDEKYVWD